MIEKLKKIKYTAILCLILLASLLLISLFNLVNLFNSSFWDIINMILVGIFFFLLGVKSGKKASKRGFLAGIKRGLLTIIIFYILNILFYGLSLDIKTIIYYLIVLASCIFGAMIGINKKEEAN